MITFEVYSIPTGTTAEADVLAWIRDGEGPPLFISRSEADAREIFARLPGRAVLIESGPDYSDILVYK